MERKKKHIFPDETLLEWLSAPVNEAFKTLRQERGKLARILGKAKAAKELAEEEAERAERKSERARRKETARMNRRDKHAYHEMCLLMEEHEPIHEAAKQARKAVSNANARYREAQEKVAEIDRALEAMSEGWVPYVVDEIVGREVTNGERQTISNRYRQLAKIGRVEIHNRWIRKVTA